jgi:Holliday junction DNA helicase RuvA
MIAYLRGRVLETGEDSVVIDVSGVGYELSCSSHTLSDASIAAGEFAIFVHTQLREDALSLFGFSSVLEKRMFLSLIKVNGVGPKMAIKILSGASLNQISGWIESGDVKALSGLPKVGKKTAEQLILSLKGKLVLMPEESSSRRPSAGVIPTPRFEGSRGEVLSALVNLGFRGADAERVVADLPESIDLQSGIRQGLQALTGGN